MYFKSKELVPTRQLWKDLEVESLGDLFRACHENKLVGLKGFGIKTQQKIKDSVEFTQANEGYFHYAKAIAVAESLLHELTVRVKPLHASITGELRRKCPVVDKIQILLGVQQEPSTALLSEILATNQLNIKVDILFCSPENYFTELFKSTGAPEYVADFDLVGRGFDGESAIFEHNQTYWVPPELREAEGQFRKQNILHPPHISTLNWKDIKGALHNHTQYSDGQNTLKEMALACKTLGLEYFGVSDHSVSAFYANGMKASTVLDQIKEIDLLNAELYPFKIFKGIESDILFNGNLDYSDDILKQFDFVVASVHSQLQMDIDKATARLIKAIENPYTTILGHPTGRLLLYRQGYPIDYQKVIDACAANEVCIELNANPYRLDIDYKWINYCTEKGVKIAINPDAHSAKGLEDIKYGLSAASKANLFPENCLNAMSASELFDYFQSRKKKFGHH